MKTWTKAAVVVGVVTLVGATGAFAFGHGRGGKFLKHMIAMRVEEAEDYVEATPEQRKVIEAAKDSIAGKLEARMAAHVGERAQWIELFAGSGLDAQAVYARVDAKADEMKAMAREIVPELIKVHDVLTPAQRQKLAEHAKAMRARHGGHHGGPGGGLGGFGGPGGDQE